MSSLGNVLPFDKKKKSASRDEQAATATTTAAPRVRRSAEMTFTDQTLTVRWSQVDQSLNIYWPDITDHSLTTRRTFAHNVWPDIDHSLTTSWPLLTTRWPHIDHTMTIHWLLDDHLLTTRWPSVDHSLAMQWTQRREYGGLVWLQRQRHRTGQRDDLLQQPRWLVSV